MNTRNTLNNVCCYYIYYNPSIVKRDLEQIQINAKKF